MANEIQFTFQLVVQNPSTGGGYYSQEQANLSLTQNTVGDISKAATVTTTAANLDISGIVTLGWAFFQNLDATNDIYIGVLGVQASAPAMSSFTNSASGGTIPANTYFVKATAVTPGGGETTVSGELSTTTTGSSSTLTMACTSVAGATSYNFYIGTSSGAENTVYNFPTFSGNTITALNGAAATMPVSNNTSFWAHTRLKAGEWAIKRLVPNAVYQARAAAGTPVLNYGIWND